MPTRRAFAFALASTLLTFTGVPAHAATIVIGGADVVEGSGRTVDETRTVTPFTRVQVMGPVDVHLRRTGTEKAVVHADDNIAALVDVKVDGGKLVVQTKDGASFRTRSKVYVDIEFKQLDALLLDGSGDVDVDDVKSGIFENSIRGSGNVRIRKVDAGTVAVSISGSGDFEGGGRADKAGFVIEGSGDVKAGDLKARSIAVRIAGSGDAVVCASDTLQVRIAGSGDVRYCGAPRIEKKIDGSGEVIPLR